MTLSYYAPAKINLTLEVLARRPDGYHDILSVLQAIDLCDLLTFAPAPDLELTCNVPELMSTDNLIIRAAQALQTAAGRRQGAAIQLQKRIPLASGLGGGSSDAAATLRGLAQLWGLADLPRQHLLEIGAQLGMDVPFFFYDGTALVEGRGDIVTPLPSLPTTWFVLLHPPVEVAGKTAKMYRSLSPASFTQGQRTNRLVDVLRRSAPLEDSLLFNTFESVADQVFPGLETIRRRFEQVSGRPAHLSGAGPSLFCLAKDKEDAKVLCSSLRSEGFEAYCCTSLVSA